MKKCVLISLLLMRAAALSAQAALPPPVPRTNATADHPPVSYSMRIWNYDESG